MFNLKNKNYFKTILILLVFSFSFLLKSAFALPSYELTYHGKLTDLSDVPVGNGDYDFVFKIFDASSGGNCVWVSRGTCETPIAKTIAVSKGIFYTNLGESGDNALTLDFNSDYWLEIKVGTNSPMSPRRKITSNHFSINSGKLNGQNSSYYLDTSATEQTKTGNFRLNGIFKDKDGDVGTNGQVLSSTGTGIDWITGSNLIDKIGTPTYTTFQHYVQTQGSTGHTSGGSITDGGSFTYNVSAGTGFVRSTDSEVAPIYSIDWAASNGNAIADGETKFIFVSYNSGSPAIVIKNSYSNDRHTEFFLGSVIREGSILHILNNSENIANGMENANHRWSHFGFQVMSGLIPSGTGTRNIKITAGEVYYGSNEFKVVDDFDSSVSDTFDVYLRNTINLTGQTQWDNQNYDNGGVKTALTTGRYGVLWIYMCSEFKTFLVYGTSNATSLASAQTESIPSNISPVLANQGFLIGRIIFQKGASTGVFESYSKTAFASSTPTDHNNLANLQGGTASEYYHLTSTQHSELSGFSTTFALPSSDGTANQVLKTNGSATLSFSDQIVGGLGSVSNLKVKNNATNPNYQIDIDADGVVVRDSSKLLQLFDLDLTLDITASGANGLDTGSEASSTWYYIWVIYNPTTSTTAGLLSISSTSPTMPSGYTYKFMVGAVKNNASSNFLAFSQINEEVWYNARQEESTGLGSTTYTTTDISDTIPTASNKVKSVLFGGYCTGTCNSYYLSLSTDGVNAKTIFDFTDTLATIGGRNELYNVSNASSIFIPITGNNIYYKMATNTGTDVILLTRAYKWSHL